MSAPDAAGPRPDPQAGQNGDVGSARAGAGAAGSADREFPPQPTILQTRLPYDPGFARRLPGTQPFDPADWLWVDDAYAAQMALRAQLIAERRDEVLRLDPAALPAARELLDLVLKRLPRGFDRRGGAVIRPDGPSVALDRDDPLGTLGHLVQEDLCLLQPGEAGHVLTGAVLCFPASWRLSEKFMRPLPRIHDPVAEYDDGLARRVQRMFDAIRPEQPLWRCNALWYDDPALHQPRSASEPRRLDDPARAGFFRSERQCLLRLPESRAVVFSIHTFVLARANAPAQTEP